MTDTDFLSLRVHRLEWAARDILEVELRAADGRDLPGYEPGAHIDLQLPNGLMRSYSLKGDPALRDRYVVGVGLDAASRGGSAYIHRTLRVGEAVPVRAPLNHFALVKADKTVLIAGGIGVTPLTCMARALAESGQEFEFHYAVRSQDRAAFLPELSTACPSLHLHTDDTEGGPLDLAAIVSGQPQGTHFYCCGPAPMMAAFEAAVAELPDEVVHVEYFSPKVIEKSGADGPFTLVLQKSGKTVEVGADETILAAVERAGITPATSCEDGICGTCETRVIEGVADHRDSVLTAKEQAAGKTMMICVSRCVGARLVLDL
jgi:ferredoxin-NADP reductase